MAFVFIAIVALVAVPWIGAHQSRPLYTQLIESIAPARGLITQINHSLAIEGAVFRDYLSTSDTALLPRYSVALERELTATESLQPLIASLGREELAALNEMRGRQLAWHRAVAERMVGRAPVARDTGYERLLDAVVRLDDLLDRDGQERRSAIMRLEMVRSRVATALGLLAIASAFVVGWLASRLRTYAVMLEERQATIDRAAKGRERLLRGVTHDLKNPLQAIDGHAQLMADDVRGPTTPDQRDSIARIRRSVRTMLSLIGDLLEVARAESGQLKIEKRDVDIALLVRDVVEQFRPAAELSGHVIALRESPPALVVRTDEARVQQILGNLLSNAAKYSPPGGGISLGVHLRYRRGAQAEAQSLAIDVIDSGDGIPPEQHEAVFGEFTRQEVHQRIPGVGLGLAISRRIARLLGGDVTLASEPPNGAAFTLWLPLQSVRPDRSRAR